MINHFASILPRRHARFVTSPVTCSFLCGIILLIIPLTSHASKRLAVRRADVIIYGGTSAAVTAAVQVKKMGKSVIIVSPDKHLGGLSSGGLSREFYQRLYQHYQQDSAYGRNGKSRGTKDREHRPSMVTRGLAGNVP